MSERDEDLRAFILAHMKRTGEVYSVEVWKAWRGHNGHNHSRAYGVPVVQRVLRRMEDAGELTGRQVLPAEHGDGNLLRRYYRLPEAA